MEPSELAAAVEAGKSVASGLGLRTDDAVVVSNSDRLVLRLLPCDVLARVSPPGHQEGAELEAEVARRLAEVGGPVGELEPRVEPRVQVRSGFAISLWTYYEPLPAVIAPSDYADALARLHAGLRRIEVDAPHFTNRVAGARALVADPEQTPELRGRDRELLRDILAAPRDWGAPEQLLHGEPHPGNLLNTRQGPLFIDLGTCCRGPIEFDIAHCPEVCPHYPGADADLVARCRLLASAMVTTWRWSRDDQFPNGRYWAEEGLRQLRAGIDRRRPDADA